MNKTIGNWKIDGGLLYQLDENGANYHEINVTMAYGSRDLSVRFPIAAEILGYICQPRAALSSYEAETIRRLAVDLEKTGRIAALEYGQAKADAILRNREVQIALCALLDSLQIPRGEK